MYDESISYDLQDELLSDREDVRLENVSVASGAAISRGMILTAADFDSNFALAAATVPAGNALVIAAENFDSDAEVVAVYTSGHFHADKLITGGTVTPYDFKEQLRRENILLTERI